MEIVTVMQSRKWYEKSHREPYLTTSIGLSPSLAREVCKIRDQLRSIDPRHIYSPSSYLHVTVKELGWLGEDVKKEDLDNVLNIVGDVASSRAPFEMTVEGIGIFPSVIYCRVGKGADEIRTMNKELVERMGDRVIQSQYDGGNMVPHISVAHFTTRDVEPLLAMARKHATRFVGKMKVREVRVKKWYPHRLFERPHSRVSVSEPLARINLGIR